MRAEFAVFIVVGFLAALVFGVPAAALGFLRLIGLHVCIWTYPALVALVVGVLWYRDAARARAAAGKARPWA